MSTPTLTFEAFTRQLAATDPANALEVAIAATEAARAETERVKEESKLLASVKMGEHGFEAENLGGIYRLGQMYARSMLVPESFQGRPDDCAIVVQLAHRWGVDPFMAFQHVYLVHGRPAVDSQIAISLLHASGKIDGTVQYEFSGEPGTDDYGCTAVVRDAATGEIVRGPKVDWKIVKAEGWNSAKGKSQTLSKWTTMPDLMFHYRAALWMIRTRYPEVIMGLQSVEELRDWDYEALAKRAAGKPASSLADLTSQLESRAEPVDDDPPEVAAREAIETACEAISRAKTIREAEAVAAEYEARDDLPAVTKQVIRATAETRAEEIRNSRGPRSNKSKADPKSEPEPSTETETPPELAASESLRTALLARLAKATEQQAINIENQALEAQSTGDLMPMHCEEVTSACRGRFRELAAEGSTT